MAVVSLASGEAFGSRHGMIRSFIHMCWLHPKSRCVGNSDIKLAVPTSVSTMKFLPVTALAIAAAAFAGADDAFDFDAGADVRIRYESMDDIPLGGYSGAGEASTYMDWFKFRTRVWCATGNDSFRIHARIGNEFRAYRGKHSSNTRNWEFPDEVFLDNLYLDLPGIAGSPVDIRIGRQDFAGPDMYGAGRVIMDGNNCDGPRTQYFDSILVRLHFSDTETMDLLGIYDSAHDAANIGDNHGGPGGATMDDRWRNTIRPGFTGVIEAGGGIYHRSRTFDALPADMYWIFKHESDARNAVGEVEAGRDMHTVGALLKPRFNQSLSAEIEAAYQFGEKSSGADISATMGYGALRYDWEGESFKPWAKLSAYYLSGDKTHDGNEDSDKAWNPVWGRWEQFSALWAQNTQYGICYYSNVVRPALEFGFVFGKNWKTNAQVGPIFAAEDDGQGGGTGRDIGWLYEIDATATLLDRTAVGRGKIATTLRAEVLDPSGSYYATDETAYFARWELNASF